MQKNDHQQTVDAQQMKTFFIPISQQVEKLLKISILFLVLSLLMAQIFILSSEEHQSLVNPSIRYEGVMTDDPIKAKATLQDR